MAYKFRISFRLPSNQHINCPNSSAQLPLSDDFKLLLKSGIEDGKLSETSDLVISSPAFPSEDEANDVGTRVKSSLLLAGVSGRIGFDVGDDRILSALTQPGKEYFCPGIKAPILPDVHGLQVYEDIEGTLCLKDKTLMLVLSPLWRLTTHLQIIYQLRCELSERQQIAAELYTMSHFEVSQSAKFLLCLYSLESLCDRERSSQSICDAVDLALETLKQKPMDSSIRDRLLSHVGLLKREGHSQAVKRTLNDRLPKRAYSDMAMTDFYDQCNVVRGEIVHEGQIKKNRKIMSELGGSLDHLTSDFILATVDEKLLSQIEACTEPTIDEIST